VAVELTTLAELGVNHVYIEDDSLLANKKRAMEIFDLLSERPDMHLSNGNGVNIQHLMCKVGGSLETDMHLLCSMADAGFKLMSLPFESGSQRVMGRWCSNKWRIDKVNHTQLVTDIAKLNIQACGNYMLGFPDETREEMFQTIDMARRHMDAGLSQANFFIVVPFPGCEMYDWALENGWLKPNLHPDEYNWTKSVFVPSMMKVDPDQIEGFRDLAWRIVNRPDFVADRIRMAAL